MKSFRTLAAAAAFLLATTAASMAAPIIAGTLGMSFTYQAEDIAGNNVALGSAVAIDFSAQNAGAPSNSNTGTFLVIQATGDFSGIAIATVGTIHDLIFNPFSGPINNFFSVGGITFRLDSLTVSQQSNTGITLIGGGVFQPGTADQSAGSWSVSFQTDGTNLLGQFTWSANATPVPEPATLGLLGMGLLGLGLARRRRRA